MAGTTYIIGGQPAEAYSAIQEDMAEQNRRREQAYRQRVEVLEAAFYRLGSSAPAVLSDTQAIAQAASTVSDRWSKLADLEQQVGRERQTLAILEAGLVGWGEVTDLDSMEAIRRSDERKGYIEKVENARASVKALEDQAKVDRRELESLAKGK